jgi:hypothetical protein
MARLIQVAGTTQIKPTQLALGKFNQGWMPLQVIAEHCHRIVSCLRFNANPERIAPT